MRMPLVSKFPLLFGGSSKEGIGGESRRAIFLNPQYSDGCQRGEREQREFWTPRTTFTALVISAAPSLVVKAIRPLVAFHRNKIPKPTLKHLFWCRRSRAGGISNHY